MGPFGTLRVEVLAGLSDTVQHWGRELPRRRPERQASFGWQVTRGFVASWSFLPVHVPHCRPDLVVAVMRTRVATFDFDGGMIDAKATLKEFANFL